MENLKAKAPSGSPGKLHGPRRHSPLTRSAWTVAARWLVACSLSLTAAFAFAQPGSFLQIENGYFWDPARQEHFIPRGFGYQTFNPPVGANQTWDQLEWDLRAFKRMYVNSLRVDLPWPQIETNRGAFDWSKSDFLVSKAEQYGLRLFVLIGFQYAADWFPTNGFWRGINEEQKPYFIMNYENPEVRLAYSNYIYQVTSRYKDSPAVGAWILGNEYSYFDLWNETNKLYFGYDPISLTNFQRYLTNLYDNRIAGLNSNWGTTYTSFGQVAMPVTYPANRLDARYYDLIQWRKHSIGELVAVGAVAARRADTNHLLTYSMIGGIFSGDDNKYTCEDEKVIVQHCAAAGAPLDFWSVNNYAYTAQGAEMRSADFGIAKYQERLGIPVLVTETGHSSTDDLYPEAQVRHAKALPTQLWEALMSGAMGVHVFTWNDRHVFGATFFPRERGFGIVNQDRTPKSPVYWNVLETFRRMENLKLEDLLAASRNPPADIQFFWSRNADMVWPRANQENAMLWGALKRLGYQPGIIDDERFAAGKALQARALILSRCWLMDPAQLNAIATNVIPAGVHVYANADFPGQLTAYQKPNPNHASLMSLLFGLNVTGAQPGYDTGVKSVDYFGRVDFTGVADLPPLTNGYTGHVGTWKVWHGAQGASGTTVITHRGNNSTQPPRPALQIKDLVTARTAITTFALGDTYSGEMPAVSPPEHQWDVRYLWLQAICSTWFGIEPAIELSGPEATRVIPDYRLCSNGSVLVGLLNESTNAAVLTVNAPGLLNGMTVENLTSGGIIEAASDGIVSLNMEGDDYVLLYAYDSAKPSLLSPTRNKLWISSAPPVLHPNGASCSINVGIDVTDPDVNLSVALERVLSPNIAYARTNWGPVSGKTVVSVPLFALDPDPKDSWYISSAEGGEYVFHAWLSRSGTPIADSWLPVRLLWALHPVSLPPTVTPGATCIVTLGWQDLPSFIPEQASLPLDHAAVWIPYRATWQYYKVTLELRSGGQVVALQEHLTNAGTGSHTFSVAVPANASGPFTWNAYLQTAPKASSDFLDSFEDRDGGDRTNGPVYLPWQVYGYPEPPGLLLNEGIGTNASDGKLAAFLVVTNPATIGSFSGFGMQYTYPQAQTFALPQDRSLWSNYTFSFDFKEANSLPCVLELQVKDNKPAPFQGVISYMTNYVNRQNGWDTIRASLDQFTIPSWAGSFDSQHASALVVNVQMLQKPATHLGFIDNVRFVGPKRTTTIVAPRRVFDSFDDRIPGEGESLLAPWGPYAYPSPNVVGAPTKLNQGIAANQGIDGSQALFLVVSNASNATDATGFGIYYGFASRWELPADKAQWANYSLSFWFREESRRACAVEMQLKSGLNDWIQLTNTYVPDGNGWMKLTGTLNQFEEVGMFDFRHVEGIALNIRMLQKGQVYIGFFDQVVFSTPEQVVPITGALYGIYLSDNDSDVQDERFWVWALRPDDSGQVELSWFARSNRTYSVEYQDAGLDGAFQTLAGLSNLGVASDRVLHVTDAAAPPNETRFYRVRAQKRGL
jgi:hypothetical protein